MSAKPSVSMYAYMLFSNSIMSKKKPNKTMCMRLDGRKRTPFFELYRSFIYNNFCKKTDCWVCVYRDYIKKVQRNKLGY